MVVYEIIAHVISHNIDVHKRIKGIIGQCLVLLFFLKLLINFTVSVTFQRFFISRKPIYIFSFFLMLTHFRPMFHLWINQVVSFY